MSRLSAAEITAFVTLWVALILLSGLVVLLYRQLERAYLATGGEAQLAAGSPFPELEIATGDGLQLFPWPSSAATMYAVLVSTKCQKCFEALEYLPSLIESERILVFTAGEWTPDVRKATEGLTCHVLGHPPDAERSLGLSGYPTVIATRQGHVLASTGEHTRSKLARFVTDAEAADIPKLTPEPIGMTP